MKNLMFWLKYKTIKNNNNRCNDCDLNSNHIERTCLFFEHPSCHYKNFKKRDYEQIAITVTAVICVVLLTIYLVLSSL